MIATLKKTVATPSAAYLSCEQQWALVRSLMGGTRIMRLRRETYLPKEPAESIKAYDIRINRTVLHNFFRKTVRDMTGRVFAKPIKFGDDVPKVLATYAENINNAGQNLDVFAFDLFADGLQAGITYILAEMPPAQPSATRRDDIVQGRRPYLVHIKAEDLIGWKSETINGQETLTQVRIKECVSEPDPNDPYEDSLVTQIRVLEPGRWAIHRKIDAIYSKTGYDEWYLYQEGVASLSYIPLAPVYINRTGFMTGSSPLEDLADLSVAHWQSSSDQRNIIHVARVPILFGSGMDDKTELVIGASSMARATAPDAKLMFVEHSGAAIGAGREDLKDLEFAMQAMGLQLLIPVPGQTATGEIRDDIKENAPLALMAKALQDALEQAFGFMADYQGLGKDAGGSLEVNSDVGMGVRDANEVTQITEAFKAGMITAETGIRELHRREFLSEELVVEDEAQAIEDQKAKAMAADLEAKRALAAPPPGEATNNAAPANAAPAA